MTPETRTMLMEWLAAGTPGQQDHARGRLAMSDAEPSAVDPPAWPTAEELARTVEQLAIVRRCPWRAAPRCGCSPARCALAGSRAVTDRQCLDCVARYGDA